MGSLSQRILVTGATGYIGGRLVPRLLSEGYSVRCLVRDAVRLQNFPWVNQVEVMEGDALSEESLVAAMQGIISAYYLIHGMQGAHPDVRRDLQAAHNFANAASSAGLQRIIYLGELATGEERCTPYLESRHETGRILGSGSVPVTEFRAGMVIGSGSVLFEMVRYTAERQPVFLCPRWFFTDAQPIGILNVLDYLAAALKVEESKYQIIEIGGASCLTYAQMLMEYAKVRGLRRSLVRLPVSAPRASAHWASMITPVQWQVLLPLIEGLQSRSVVTSDLAQKLFPEIHPMDFTTALTLALGRVASDAVETKWSDALVNTMGDSHPVTLTTTEGMMFERRRLKVDMDPSLVFQSYTGLGGDRGWLFMDWAWRIRGWMDKLIGGVGLRRGRRNPNDLRVGEALDFWRVEEIIPDRLVRLRAEMKVPGKAWLEFQSNPQPEGGSLLVQTAYFAPRGLAGFLYWYVLYPIHSYIFSGMIRRIAQRAAALLKDEGRNYDFG